MELSNEMNERMKEASKDKAWAGKVRAAANWEEFAKLLAEKGIEASEELKEEFKAAFTDKTGELEDDELEKVSGGAWVNIFNCPREYSKLLCELTFCPHLFCDEGVPIECYDTLYCELHNWSKLYNNQSHRMED